MILFLRSTLLVIILLCVQVKADGVPDSFLQLTLHFLPKLGIVTVRNSLGGEAKLTGEVKALM